MIQNSSKKQTWANDDEPIVPDVQESVGEDHSRAAEEPNAIQSHTQRKKAKVELPERPEVSSRNSDKITQESKPGTYVAAAAKTQDEQVMGDGSSAAAQATDETVSDGDWLRSKTSRLLGLLDEDEQAGFSLNIDPETETVTSRPVNPIASVSADEDDAETGAMTEIVVPEQPKRDENIDLIRNSARLFVRNLPYDATEGDLEPIFLPFGRIEEVRARP